MVEFNFKARAESEKDLGSLEILFLMSEKSFYHFLIWYNKFLQSLSLGIL